MKGNYNWWAHDFPTIFIEDLGEKHEHSCESMRIVLQKPERAEWTNANCITFCVWEAKEDVDDHAYYSSVGVDATKEEKGIDWFYMNMTGQAFNQITGTGA